MRRNRNKKKHVLTFLAGTVVTTSTNGVSAQIIIPSDSTQFDVSREEISCYGNYELLDPRRSSWVMRCLERPQDLIAKVLVGSACVVLVITGASVIGYIWSAGSDLPPSDLSSDLSSSNLSSSALSSTALPSTALPSNDSILEYAGKSLEECFKLLGNGTQQCTTYEERHDTFNGMNCQLTTKDNVSSWIPSSWQSAGKFHQHKDMSIFNEELGNTIISYFDGAKTFILSSKESFEALLKGIQKEGGHLAKFANCAVGSA